MGKRDLIEYLNETSNITFEELPFNNIDALVFSAMSYFNFPFEKKVKLIDCCRIIDQSDRNSYFKGLIMTERLLEIPSLIIKSIRYKEVYLLDFFEEFNAQLEKQFAAISIMLPDNTIFISYRGSDNTLFSWKEDFKLAYLDSIPSQELALKYFFKIAEKYVDSMIYLGGYSKGGNLAIYAAINGNKELPNRIDKVFNFDGPGFLKHIVNSKEYLIMRTKTLSVSPKSSIVGTLLWNEDIKRIKSSSFSIFQHKITTWKIKDYDFIYTNKQNFLSNKMVYIVNRVVSLMNKDELEFYINDIFSSLNKIDVYYMSDIRKKLFKSIFSVFSSVKKIKSRMKELKKQVKNEAN